MSSVFGLKATPSRATLLAPEAAEVLLQLPDHAPLLELVDLDHRVQKLEVVARVGRQLLQRKRILREAAAAVADPRAKEARADPPIETDAFGDADDIGAGRLADVRDLVDEADPRHQRRVRGQLDHLGRGDVAVHDGRVDPGVELLDRLAVSFVERADDDPIRVLEVAHRRSLRRELGVGRVADVLEPACVEPVADVLARSDGDGALHHHHGEAVESRELVDDGPDGGEIGVTRVRRRRSDGDVEELGVLYRLRDVECVGQPLGVAAQQLLEAGLVDRDLTGAAAARSGRGRTSRMTTSCPRSAKHAPVTRPT